MPCEDWRLGMPWDEARLEMPCDEASEASETEAESIDDGSERFEWFENWLDSRWCVNWPESARWCEKWPESR